MSTIRNATAVRFRAANGPIMMSLIFAYELPCAEQEPKLQVRFREIAVIFWGPQAAILLYPSISWEREEPVGLIKGVKAIIQLHHIPIPLCPYYLLSPPCSASRCLGEK